MLLAISEYYRYIDYCNIIVNSDAPIPIPVSVSVLFLAVLVCISEDTNAQYQLIFYDIIYLHFNMVEGARVIIINYKSFETSQCVMQVCNAVGCTLCNKPRSNIHLKP